MKAEQLQSAAEAALAAMRAAGFEHAQVSAACSTMDELNVVDNEPSLMRSGESLKLAVAGIVDQRMASTELTTLDPDQITASVKALFADARSAPQDAAYAVSSGQVLDLVQGPQVGDRDTLAEVMAELLAFRRANTPKMTIGEGQSMHLLHQSCTLTTGGSRITTSVGSYALQGFGTARDGDKSSSFNAAGGRTNDLRSAPAPELFGIGAMLRETERQIHTKPFGTKFSGDVVFTPEAVGSLVGWLLGQLGDAQLIAGSSIYRSKVGQAIAASPLTLRSWFDAPGVAAVSGDAFRTPAVTIVENGVLKTLTPSLYGSRKTGLAHVPVSAGGGWEVAAGKTPLPELIGGVKKGALVGRLSMGNPAANGNFSAVIKNSFAIENGEIRDALSETMIAGNMAQMLKDIVDCSVERLDGEGSRLPWVRMKGLHFS